MRDPYAELGLARGVDQDAIRKAYKDLAKQYHPDLNPNDEASADRFKRVSAAYEALKDSDRRALFDEFGEAALKPGFDGARARAWKQSRGGGSSGGGFPGFGGAGGDGGNLDDILGSFFGGQGRGGRGPRRTKGRDIEAQLTVDLGAVVRGEKIDVSYVVPERRPDGSVARTTPHIKVVVPVGVEEGGTVRVRGKGAAGSHGGPDGDLLLIIHFAPHPTLRRDGANLYMDVPLTIHEAVAGGKIEVPTPGGSVRLSIPAGTQSGRKMRLKGKGMAGKNGSGDLYLVLRPTPPESDDPEVARLAEALGAFYTAGVRDDLRI